MCQNMNLEKNILQTPNMNTGYFGNYQLLGDSQFVRFCVEILDLRSTSDAKNRAQVGFCISGQDSVELARLVEQNYDCLHDNLIIMIGTNDVKKKVHENTFAKAICSLKSTLEWKSILWLTIPPIPTFQNSKRHVTTLKNCNEEIMNLHGNNIQVLDAYNLFLDKNGSLMSYCFEEYYQSRNPPYRRDDIHLNRKGLIRLSTWLCFHQLPQKINDIQLYRDRKGSLVRAKLYQEFLYLSSLLPNSTGTTREELYDYIMGPYKMYS